MWSLLDAPCRTGPAQIDIVRDASAIPASNGETGVSDRMELQLTFYASSRLPAGVRILDYCLSATTNGLARISWITASIVSSEHT
jgi:hypothetical protein